MNDLITVKRPADWQRMKDLVLNSVSSPITRRVYDMVLNEFMDWYQQAPRPGFSKATVSAWRASLEARKLGSSSIIIRMSAIRKLAGEAADNGLLAPELAAGIARVKSVKSTGIRTGFPDTCVIYDSRVAAALTSILDPAMCLISDSPEWQEYSRLGTISGRGLASSECVMEVADRLRHLGKPDGSKSFMPEGGRTAQQATDSTIRLS